MTIRVKSIYRHPVKGLTPELVEAVKLTPGRGIPNDRRFALALSSTAKELASTKWVAKSNFLTLQKNERLAKLETRFDDKTETLSVARGGHQVARCKLTNRIGRTAIEDFFSTFFKGDALGRPKLIEASGNHILSDCSSPVVSVLNLSSIKDLERVTQRTVDPLRFRANIWLEGIAPWIEFEWIKKRITIGNVSLTVTDRIDRCAAVNVNPATGERDHNIVKALKMGYLHLDFGVYMKVASSGIIKVGDAVKVPA